MTLTIIIAIVAFLVITLVLVGLLLFAKAKLTTSGDVTIDINGGEKVLIAESGGTLLSTLANNNVFLPSACGGGGSCGMCKCQVLEGGGELLPTETGFINRKMAKEHWRLGCQVKVKENLKIHVPESVLGGCTLMMFGTIMVSGIQMISKAGFSQRNVTIVALSLAVGIGFTSASEMDIWRIFPQVIQDVFSANCVAVVFVMSILLSALLPKDMEIKRDVNTK